MGQGDEMTSPPSFASITLLRGGSSFIPLSLFHSSPITHADSPVGRFIDPGKLLSEGAVGIERNALCRNQNAISLHHIELFTGEEHLHEQLGLENIR